MNIKMLQCFFEILWYLTSSPAGILLGVKHDANISRSSFDHVNIEPGHDDR